MQTIKQTNKWGRTDVYEVVDSVPAGFMVWNIGEYAPAGYVPLVELLPGEDWQHNVNMDTLKAIKSDHAREILRAASCGGSTLAECEEIAAKGYSGELDETLGRNADEYAMKRCAAALPYMRAITWEVA